MNKERKFEHEGITIWYATADTPFVDQKLVEGQKGKTDLTVASILIGVHPSNPGNKVFLHYRINEGPEQLVQAAFFHAIPGRKGQYFRAVFPILKPGDDVSYWVECTCSKRRAPGKVENNMLNSFRISGKERQGTNEKPASPILLDSVDAPNQPETSREEQTRAEKVKEGIGTLKGKRLKRQRLLQKFLREDLREKFDTAFAAANGGWDDCCAKLRDNGDFDEESIKTATFIHQLAEVSDDNEPLIASFHLNDQTFSLRDVALRYNRAKLREEIRKTGAPEDPEGGDEEERLTKYVNKVADRIFLAETTPVIHRMVRDAEMPIADLNIRQGVVKFLDNQPGFDIRRVSVYTAFDEPDAFKDVPEQHHESVRRQMKAMQFVAPLSPNEIVLAKLMELGLDSAYTINQMPANNFVRVYGKLLGGEDVAKQVHNQAQKIATRNEHALFALRHAMLSPGIALIDGGKSVETRKQMFAERANLQSVAGPAPGGQPTVSSTTIASGARRKIPVNWETLFGSADFCECGHCNSVYSPSAYLVELFQYLRNNNLDPDATAPQNIRPNPRDIAGTPLAALLERRPDLGRLKLTCENAHTTLPYIDLVNEVMESYVVYLDKKKDHPGTQKRIPAYNVEEETDAQLLAEPHHTNYKAYCILKDEVYPCVRLPYHQPIDAARLYLEYLGTSRHELLKTFVAKIEPQLPENATEAEIQRLIDLEENAQQRAIDAEYLYITEEEYVILTKNAFLPEGWYDLQPDGPITRQQYREQIGVRPVHEYYGYSSEAAMLNGLKWVKPAPTPSGSIRAGFLRRTGLLYTELVELLKTQFVNPNYPSGENLEILNRIRFSYRYLQFLEVADASNYKEQYARVVRVLKGQFRKNYPGDHYDVECWVHRYFRRIGKIIVLESGSDCTCREGTLIVSRSNPDGTFEIVARVHANCTITLDQEIIGYVNRIDGSLMLDDELPENIKNLLLTEARFKVDNKTIGGVSNGKLAFRQGNHLLCDTPPDFCDLTQVQLKHLDGSDLEPWEYDDMHRFIRLWRKMGWTMDELDRAIVRASSGGAASTVSSFAVSPSEPGSAGVDLAVGTHFVAFQPADQAGDCGDNTPDPGEPQPKPGRRIRKKRPVADCTPLPPLRNPYEITPGTIRQLVALKRLLDLTGAELIKLLSFWNDISTRGEKSLYHRLFLTHNQLGLDDVFKEDQYGTFLADETLIREHLPVIMAAFKVNTEQIETILSYTGLLNSELTLANISVLYRHVLLAKTLGIRIEYLPMTLDLLTPLARPFESPQLALRFVEIYQRIEDSGFKPQQLAYIIRGKDDIHRPLTPTPRVLLNLATTLRDALRQIDTDHPDITDPTQATDDFIRTKLALMFDEATTKQAVDLLNGAFVTLDTTRRKITLELDEPIAASIETFFKDKQKIQNNLDEGVLDESDPDPAATAAEVEQYRNFLKRVQYKAGSGFQIAGVLGVGDIALFPDLPAYPEYEVAILKMLKEPGKFFDDVLTPVFAADIEEAKLNLLSPDTLEPNTAQSKREYFTRIFMPYLREQLRQRQVTKIMGAAIRTDPDVTRLLLWSVILGTDGQPVYHDIIRLKEQQTTAADGAPLKGYLCPGQDGEYRLTLEVFQAPDAEPRSPILKINGKKMWTDPLVQIPDEEGLLYFRSDKIYLKAGEAYEIVLKDYDTDEESGKIIGFFWKMGDKPQEPVPAKVLFEALDTDSFRQIYLKLQKAALVIGGFDLAAAEVELLHEYRDYFSGLDFNGISLEQWLRLEALTRLRERLPQSQLSLLEFLRWTHDPDNAPAGAAPDPDENPVTLLDQLAKVSNRKTEELAKMIAAAHFDLDETSNYHDEKSLLQLLDAFTVSDKIGIDIDKLFEWAVPTSHFNRTRKIATDIRNAIRARYTQEEWEQAIKPVHDKLRENQKQALIQYLLVQPELLNWGVVDADSLYEYFLIDVQMDACMDTSRIVQAIAAVQLFVQRCMLGLEENHGIPANVLDRQRWEWMSRYRVWEANRKVFLYPENWIEPELRDNKSPFFKELESELLQNDISEENVSNALISYLYKVDQVANLEVVGLYLDGKLNPGEDEESGKLHVFSRTRNAPYFFFYRYYDTGERNWYPWEKMEVDIPSYDVETADRKITGNGCYLVPVVWNGRLLIFFPQFIKKTLANNNSTSNKISDMANEDAESAKPLEYWEIKMAWSEYQNGKWAQKQLSNDSVSISYQQLNVVTKESEFDFHGIDFEWIYREVNKLSKTYNDINSYVFVPVKDGEDLRFDIHYNGTVVEYVINAKYTATKEEYEKFGDKAEFKLYEFDFHKQEYKNTITSTEVSFIFSDNNIIRRNIKSNVNTDSSNGFPDNFHKINSDTFSTIRSLQSYSDNAPDFHNGLFFRIERNSSIVYIPNANNLPFPSFFFHMHINKALGAINTGGVLDMFKNLSEWNHISVRDENYGSDDNIIFNEQKRPYAIYNWELLFHSVALIADRLTKSQRFEEAMKWWHFIFNPIDNDGSPNKAWQFLPFRVTNANDVLEGIFNSLQPNASDTNITEWRDNPFKPHLIARARPPAYMMNTAMKYIDNLIAWADYLFRQDTRETITQATQLYILANHILGPRPELIPKRGYIESKSYMDLLDKWDAFGNAVVELEIMFPYSVQIDMPVQFDGKNHYGNIYGFGTALYFCIPNNPKLLGYWDTVADRLYKIRHCLNIEGVFRSLALFDPPIDPGLLVRAAAQGLSLSSVLNDLNSPMPNYRFTYLLQRALELCSEVKSLGNALLSALEKKDNEAIGLLRARHDTRMQDMVMEIKKQQLEEAEKSLEALYLDRKLPEYRLKCYQQLTGNDVEIPGVGTDFKQLEDEIPGVVEESGLKLIPFEKEEMDKAKLSADLQLAAGVTEVLASILYAIPMMSVDGKPVGIGVGLEFGGTNLGQLTQAITKSMQIAAGHLSHQSSSASRKGGFLRALQDRIFQANLAGFELQQIDRKITSQQIRIAIANQEISNQQALMDNAQEVEDFLKNKYTNEQLYQWMIGQIKTNYYQVYTMAYDFAKKAEKVFRFEKGIRDSNYIQFGYWDGSRDGLLAGEGLYLALKQLEKTYIETRGYDYEITKHVSLLQLNPLALIQLKETGVCDFDIPETLFDMDYPGHYKRRIRSVAVSVPCVVGPYTSLNCMLRLQKHEYRDTAISTSYPKNLEESDERFVTNVIPIKAIAVSQGQNDSGVFELNFNGERYVPFEGAGAISSWRLELPNEFRQFDYNTISDVILHIRYTSCEGGDQLKTAAISNLQTFVSNAEELSRNEGLFRAISLRHEMPAAWHRFLHPAEGEVQTMELGDLKDRLPFFTRAKSVTSVELTDFWVLTQVNGLSLSLFNGEDSYTLGPAAPVGALSSYLYSDMLDITGVWRLENTGTLISPDQLKDMVVLVRYQMQLSG